MFWFSLRTVDLPPSSRHAGVQQNEPQTVAPIPNYDTLFTIVLVFACENYTTIIPQASHIKQTYAFNSTNNNGPQRRASIYINYIIVDVRGMQSVSPGCIVGCIVRLQCCRQLMMCTRIINTIRELRFRNSEMKQPTEWVQQQRHPHTIFKTYCNITLMNGIRRMVFVFITNARIGSEDDGGANVRTSNMHTPYLRMFDVHIRFITDIG